MILMVYRWEVDGCTAAFLLDVASRVGSISLEAFFFSIRFVSVSVVHPYCSLDIAAAGKKMCFILSDRSVFYMTDNLSLAVYTFACRVLVSFSEVGEFIH